MKSLAEQLVAEFLSEYRVSGTYLRDHVTRLAELAISDDEEVAKSATRAFFTALVERLADSFEPDAVSLYNRAFAQLVQICRHDARAKVLDHELEQFSLVSEEDVFTRAERVRAVRPLTVPRERADNLKRAIVLSRVTLGADVAITSLILERMKRVFPGAEIVLLGGRKAEELLGGEPRVRFKEINYRRGETTIGRLLTWIDLLECVRQLTRGLKRSEYLIVDPDTRLTQLGLLPITRDQDPADLQSLSISREPDVASLREGREYLFFPSREYGSGTSQSLAELTSAWLDEVFGKGTGTYPRLSLRQDDVAGARSLLSLMKGDCSRRIVAINFGVGENQLKRVSGDFEASLVARLARDGVGIVFDKGAGEDETSRADAVIAEARRIERDGRRLRAIEIDERSLTNALNSGHLGAEILVWNGRIGVFAALIGESDLYIGYDSAGAHIAAALGVPCIDVFAGFSSTRFIDRWQPTGKAEMRVVAVNAASVANGTELFGRVLQNAGEMLRGRS